MKVLLVTTLLVGATLLRVTAAESTGPARTQSPARIELPDQFETLRVMTFPTTNITLLTVADKAGSEQIVGWVEPVKRQFEDRVVIEGIADVSTVPKFLRGLVRRKFQKAQTHPVMLDWSGTVVRTFSPLADQANILVLDREGKILKHWSGVATPEAVKELCETLKLALTEPGNKVARR